MRTVSPHITHDVTRSGVAQVQVVPSTIVIPSLAQCLTPCTEHAAHVPHLLPLFEVYKGCSHPGNPCANPREHGGDGYTDPEPLTGKGPKRIVDNQTINEYKDITCTEDNRITEIEGHVKSLPYNQSLLSSTQDTIESIAMPQEADLDDEQIRAVLASPRYLLEREASAERSVSASL